MIIKETSDDREVASKFGYLAMGWALAPMVGPLFGGLLTQLFGWRSNFIVFAMLGASALALSLHQLKETSVPSSRSGGTYITSYGKLLSSGRFEADFELPGDNTHLLRISFDRPCIIRLLDEMPLSTEDDDGLALGLVPEHFAYRVQGSAFERAQSSPWKHASGQVSHYRFITGCACLDVISAANPLFKVVARP